MPAGSMLISRAVLESLRAGQVDLAFRRWERPRVRVGTRLRTAVGVVLVTSLDEVPPPVDDEEARRSGADSAAAVRRQLDFRGDGRTYRIGLRYVGADPRVALRQNDAMDEEEVAELIGRLDRLDRLSPRGSWTRETLALIEANPATRAADLATLLGRDRLHFKRDVRKLKELGLTESLAVGYRLSPRGQRVLSRL
jgi:hypothetical protein